MKKIHPKRVDVSKLSNSEQKSTKQKHKEPYKESTKPGAGSLRKLIRSINPQPDKLEGKKRVSKLTKSEMKVET